MKVGSREVKYVAELITIDSATELYPYEHRYWDRYSAITCNEYGRGKAYYIGAYPDKEVLKKVLNQALAEIR